MRTVALLRCSSMNQDQEMAAQRADILAWSESSGIVIADEDWRLEPDVSGKSKERTELQKIVEECRADLVQRVVFADFQRAGRRGAETVLMLEELAEWGVDLVFVRTGKLDLTTYEGRAWALIYAAMGLLKLEEVSRSTKSGMRQAKARGAPVGTPPIRWTAEQDAKIVAWKGDGKSNAWIAGELRMVDVERAFDEDGNLAAATRKPVVSRRLVEKRATASAVRDRLRALAQGAAS